MISSFLSDPNRTNYVIDTSVLAYHGESIHSFPGHNLYLSMEVLEELDQLKTRLDQTGSACRYVNRFLDQLRSKGNLAEGVILDNQQIIKILPIINQVHGMKDSVDNKIIANALELFKHYSNVKVVSRDIALRLKCDAMKVAADTYEKHDFQKNEYFDGILTVEVEKEKIDEFYANGILEVSEELYYNQGIVLKAGKASALGIALNKNQVQRLQYAGEKGFGIQGIMPRSKEQIIACELLLDPNVDLVSIVGQAGSGKTLLSVAAALELLHQKTYKKLIIARPTQSTSKDIGFLPGEKSEKLAPWLQPIFDNIEVILGQKSQSYIDLMFDKGIIEMEALTYVRGRTLPDTIFIIDEAQNISHYEAKALLTRMGERSKIILLGDLEQIDSPILDQSTSGLNSIMNLFKEFPRSGHIRLKKGERSELATFASKVM